MKILEKLKFLKDRTITPKKQVIFAISTLAVIVFLAVCVFAANEEAVVLRRVLLRIEDDFKLLSSHSVNIVGDYEENPTSDTSFLVHSHSGGTNITYICHPDDLEKARRKIATHLYRKQRGQETKIVVAGKINPYFIGSDKEKILVVSPCAVY